MEQDEKALITRLQGFEHGLANDEADLVQQAISRITELESLLAEAREVVKPFADESAQWNGPGSDRNLALAVSESKFGAVDAMFSLSDLRRAAALSTKLEQAETK